MVEQLSCGHRTTREDRCNQRTGIRLYGQILQEICQVVAYHKKLLHSISKPCPAETGQQASQLQQANKANDMFDYQRNGGCASCANQRVTCVTCLGLQTQLQKCLVCPEPGRRTARTNLGLANVCTALSRQCSTVERQRRQLCTFVELFSNKYMYVAIEASDHTPCAMPSENLYKKV